MRYLVSGSLATATHFGDNVIGTRARVRGIGAFNRNALQCRGQVAQDQTMCIYEQYALSFFSAAGHREPGKRLLRVAS